MYQSQVTKVKENYYIGSLPGLVEGRELRHYLSQFGEVLGLEIIKDPATNKCKGYAFLSINLRIREQEFLSIRHKYGNRVIFLRPKLRGSDLQVHKEGFQQKRLFISTLSSSLTDKHLFDYFSTFGSVDLAYFVQNYSKFGSRDSKRFGYVNFHSEVAVNRVLERSKHVINGEVVKCESFRDKATGIAEHPNTNRKHLSHSRPSKKQPGHSSKLKTASRRTKKPPLLPEASFLEKTNETCSGSVDASHLNTSRKREVEGHIASDFLTISSLIQANHSSFNVRYNIIADKNKQ